jgi:tRNA threonylcarbamoyladenosine biosynthesis protein TsaE
MNCQSRSEEETTALGFSIGSQLPINSIVCFFGDLGAGKTALVRGIIAGATGLSTEVNSPTFVYLNIHTGSKTVFHFDLYRLRDADEFLSMGFDDYFFAGGICCVEWSEKIANILPENCIRVYMQHLGENLRGISIIPGKES